MAFNFMNAGSVANGGSFTLFTAFSGDQGAQYVQYTPNNSNADLLTTNQRVLKLDNGQYQYLATLNNLGPNSTEFNHCGGGLT